MKEAAKLPQPFYLDVSINMHWCQKMCVADKEVVPIEPI